mmetsp:Transcript_30084/g.54411  ORF Transcript_30084/g.54411 Transcript_30084/m.54411 type:complete len:227 (-) Transcript_30084:3935-4615(-)
MVTSSFGNGKGTTVSYSKTFTSTAICMKVTASCAVQTCVTNNTGFSSNKASTGIRYYNNFAAVHALAHVVIGFTRQSNIQARKDKGTKRLTSTSIKLNGNLSLESLVAVGASNVSSEHCTCTAVGILNGKDSNCFALIIRNHLADIFICHNLAIQIGAEFVNVYILFLGNLDAIVHCGTKETSILGSIGDSGKEWSKFDALGLCYAILLIFAFLQKIRATNQVFKL